uniref:Uncharacterized protein n=1 Tax=Curvibacter symbiont subsp. Hydra magnipapillata TaxID=667019 RepID=C9YGS7_CURXX|nr:hypothetical protein Csp_B19770 [Curvibacter putative symbiont of Hydra magnipapillata]
MQTEVVFFSYTEFQKVLTQNFPSLTNHRFFILERREFA